MIIETGIKDGCLDAVGMDAAIKAMARELISRIRCIEEAVFVGIFPRGDILAERLADAVGEANGFRPPVGRIEISSPGKGLRESTLHLRSIEIPFAIEGRTVVLVDDLIRTGDTVEAALKIVQGLGCASNVLIAVLVDCSAPEAFVRSDIVGVTLPIGEDENIMVYFEEEDGFSEVLRAMSVR